MCVAVKERLRVDRWLADMTNDQPIGQVMVLVVVVVVKVLVLVLPQKKESYIKTKYWSS